MRTAGLRLGDVHGVPPLLPVRIRGDGDSNDPSAGEMIVPSRKFITDMVVRGVDRLADETFPGEGIGDVQDTFDGAPDSCRIEGASGVLVVGLAASAVTELDCDRDHEGLCVLHGSDIAIDDHPQPTFDRRGGQDGRA